MAKYHIGSIQTWESFFYESIEFSLNHLDAHDLFLIGKEKSYKFIVTYGLHCFAKNDTAYNISIDYPDGRERRMICMERYNASKNLRRIIEDINASIIYQISGEKFFTVERLNDETKNIEPYKVCLAFFKENRLLRIHVTSAFFARTGEGSNNNPVNKKAMSVFKVAMDIDKKPKNAGFPKETQNKCRL